MKLKMKYIVSFLAFCFLLSSCDSSSDVENASGGADSALLDPLDMVSDEFPQTGDGVTVNDFMEIPFTVMGPKNQLNEWKEKDKVYGEDTLRTIRFKNSVFRVMNHTYIDATIYDEELKVVYDICVGMSRNEFESRFATLEENDHRPYIKKDKNTVLLSCCSDLELHDKWQFEFYKDTLDLIKFDHYVDSDLEFPAIDTSSEVL